METIQCWACVVGHQSSVGPMVSQCWHLAVTFSGGLFLRYWCGVCRGHPWWFQMTTSPLINANGGGGGGGNKMEQLLRLVSMPFVLPDHPRTVVGARKFTIDYNAECGGRAFGLVADLVVVDSGFGGLLLCTVAAMSVITTLGLLHNMVEMCVIRELGLASPHPNATVAEIGQCMYAGVPLYWKGLEILSGVLGTVESQFMTLVPLGAACDVGRYSSYIHWWCMRLAVGTFLLQHSTFLYIVIYAYVFVFLMSCPALGKFSA